MHRFPFQQIVEVSGTAIPLTILLIEDDAQRAFLTEMYFQYRALMYKTAMDFFEKGSHEIEDAVSASVERMCRYCHAFQAAECNKRASYVVVLVGNVCRNRLREIKRQRSLCNDGFTTEEMEQLPGEDDVHGTVFDRIYAVDLLNSFDELSARERDLILMRHVDLMDYDEMAALLHMREGAVRTALSRAKKHLEALAGAAKGGTRDREE